MRWLLSILLVCQSFATSFDEVTPSTPEEIASLNADLLVEGFVSAVSGQLSLVETDLHIRGAQDILLRRTYLPPSILGRYEDKPERDRLELGKALYQLHAKGWATCPHLFAGYNRKSPYFQVRDPYGTVLEFQIADGQGYLKTAEYGCTNLRGGVPSAEMDIRNVTLRVEETEVKVLWPNGTERVYQQQYPGIYRLDRELLPNGKALRYFYDNRGLSRIASTDVSGQYTYATIDRIGDYHYRGSDGREVQLSYDRREIKGKIKKKKSKETVSFQFPVLTQSLNPNYTNHIGYNDRTLLNAYDAKPYPISCTYSEPKNAPCRIHTFSTPSGSTTFAYDPPIAGQKGGSTTVTHPNGSQTVYRFHPNFLLSSFENWFEGKLYNQKLFSYDPKQHISSIETRSGEGALVYAKRYECDSSGNPTLETWEGDFGTFSIRRVFSNNRVIREDFSDGLGFVYEYLGNTHLLSSKQTLCNGTQIRRTEYAYDGCYNLVEEREVGQTITTYLLYQGGPHLHRPEWQITKDWEGKLLHKTRFSYDRFGNLSEEAHYGDDDAFAYRTAKIYDSHGHLLEETNPLGQMASYSYDVRGRQITETPFAQTFVIHRSFDDKGRLVCLQNGHHTTRFAYNSSDELIHKIDYLGLETHTRYHPVHGAPVRIEEGSTLTEIAYDDLGRETSRKDAYGATTLAQPNSYGDPLSITHPGGGKEVFQYAPNRTLVRATDPDGLTTSCTYDPLKRMLSKTVGTRKTSYTYDAYHLLSETDPLGNITQYQYNLAGKKVQKTRGDKDLQFSYDALGFLSKVENGSRCTVYKNDVLGRTLTQSIDGMLDTTYTYNSAGRVASITQQETTYFTYDPYDRLIEKIAGDGAKTTISYEEEPQRLTKTITNPKGAQTDRNLRRTRPSFQKRSSGMHTRRVLL